MARSSKDAERSLDALPPLPLEADHWQAVCRAMQLSAQQVQVLELLLRGAGQKQIAAALGISQPTLKTYLDRIAARTGARGRMQLAMHVMAVSHEVRRPDGVIRKDDSSRRRPKR